MGPMTTDVEYNGKTLKIDSDPYLDRKTIGNIIYDGYFAVGSDDEGNKYDFFWEVTNCREGVVSDFADEYEDECECEPIIFLIP